MDRGEQTGDGLVLRGGFAKATLIAEHEPLPGHAKRLRIGLGTLNLEVARSGLVGTVRYFRQVLLTRELHRRAIAGADACVFEAVAGEIHGIPLYDTKCIVK